MSHEKFRTTVDHENEDGSIEQVHIELPKFKHLPGSFLRENRSKPDTTILLEGLYLAAEQANASGQLDKLTIGEIGDLAAEWHKDSKVSPGESSASSNS